MHQDSTAAAPFAGLRRLAPIIVAVVAMLAGVHAMDPSIVGVFKDDAHYVVLAKALATGEGYRNINIPGAPAATHFPPGYPAFLALLWFVSPEFPANVALFRTVNALLLGVIAFGVFRVSTRLLRHDMLTAAVVAIASTATIPMLLFSSNVMSETLFLALLIPWLAWCERALDDAAGPSSLRTAALIGASAAGLTLIRSHAVVLILAVVWVLLTQQRRRHAAASAGAAILVLLPWLAWVARHDDALPFPLRTQYGSYGSWFIDALRSDGMALLTGTVAQNIATMRAVLVRTLTIAPNPVLDTLAVIAFLVLVVAGALEFRKRWRMALLFVVLYMLVVLVWPFSPLRFVWSIWPLFVLLLASGAHALWRSAAARSRAAIPIRVITGASAGLLIAGTIAFNIRGYANRWWNTVTVGLAPRIQPQLAWVAEHTDSSAVIASSDEAAIYLYTGRAAVPVARFPASEYLRPRDPDDEVVELRALLRIFEPTHVLASTRATQRTVVALTAREPTLVLADSLPGGGLVYRSR